MTASPTTAPSLRAEAVARLRAGDHAGARAALEDYLATGAADCDALVMLSGTRHRLGDVDAAHAAVDQALAIEPAHLRALLAKADLLTAGGALREANLYYRALRQHAETATALPADVAAGVARAKAIGERLAANMNAELRRELERAGYEAGGSEPRFTHALDLLTGRRRLYTPQPRAFYYPELPNHQFYPRSAFPWLDAVEAATVAMTEELFVVLEDDAAFAPYLRSVGNLPSSPEMALLSDSMDWSAAFLWKDGEETPLAARCPRTMAALADAPLCHIKARSPQVMFSQLKGGAHIKPHTGFVNTRLVCHVPLVIPPGCWFRVGNETREWERGKAWVFDDTMEHEARNTGDQTRVVLIFDIWRPELSQEERGLVATLLETLDAFSPSRAAWE